MMDGLDGVCRVSNERETVFVGTVFSSDTHGNTVLVILFLCKRVQEEEEEVG